MQFLNVDLSSLTPFIEHYHSSPPPLDLSLPSQLHAHHSQLLGPHSAVFCTSNMLSSLCGGLPGSLLNRAGSQLDYVDFRIFHPSVLTVKKIKGKMPNF